MLLRYYIITLLHYYVITLLRYYIIDILSTFWGLRSTHSIPFYLVTMLPKGPLRHSLQHIAYSHLFSASPYQLGQGKLGSMCGKLTYTSSMGSDRDSNPQPT